MSRSYIVLCLLIVCFCSVLAAEHPFLWVQKQAKAGDPWAQLNLGAAFDHGDLGLIADASAAVHWYKLAAEQGIAEAQFNLAHCLATGHGTGLDYVAARYWMGFAAKQGLSDAQFLLGMMLDQGLGGVVDSAAAQAWLKLAAEQGNTQALNYIKNH